MKHYGVQVAKVILADCHHGMMEIREDGIWPTQASVVGDPAGDLRWSYFCELDWPDSPDPLASPYLPIPFTAYELAAFMLNGIGTSIPAHFRDWHQGLDAHLLDAMGTLATKAREVLNTSYNAILDAEAVVGPYPKQPEQQLQALLREWDQLNGDENNRKKVFQSGISRDEAQARREKVKTLIAGLEERCLAAQATFDAAFASWRKRMVNFLLPTPFQRLWRAVQMDEEQIRSTLEELHRIPATNQRDLAIRDERISAKVSELDLALRRKEALRSGISTGTAHDAEIAYTIQEMKAAREGSYARVSADVATRFAFEIRAANEEIDTLIASRPEIATKEGESRKLNTDEATEPIRYKVLASRTQLIEVFASYGVEMKIFRALKDRPGLKAARRVKGRGQRGSLVEPMFCPYAVMNWLVNTGVDGKPRLSAFTGWHLLETKFPDVYSEKSVGDPRHE